MKTELIKAIIVDDEEEARDVLEKLLMRVGDIHIIGKASDADIALDMIIKKEPDIVFLDIQMPEKTGFDLIKDLKKFNIKTTVIFVTAYVDFAINAMKVTAFDYLLKPVAFDELKETILRFRTEKKQELYEKKVDVLLDMLNKQGKICFNTRTGYIYISPEEIVFCSADVNYTEIYFSKSRKDVVTVNIGKMEEMLQQHRFHRISRSHLINIDYLAKADRKSKTCELFKDGEKYIIPAPPNQIRILESLIHSGKFHSGSPVNPFESDE
ncbi:MAG: LytTR family DNA-binding domain-containing protein [Bacteroidales bacterium]|nr:LytTR family DNA-binding domain-containing protein [Bacteroidales bacterium]